MATKKKPLTPAMVAKRRRSHLRQRLKQKGELTPEETAELEALIAAARPGPGRPPAEAAPDDENENPEDELDSAPEGDAPPVVEASAPPPPPPPIPRAVFPPAPPLEKPPRVSAAPEAGAGKEGKAGGAWQDKYRATSKGTGREGTVTFIADQIITVLSAMSDQCKAVGVQPLIEPEQLRGAWILTLDNVLPDKVQLTPEMQACAGSTLIIGQRFFNRKKIAEHLKKQDERAKHDEFRRKQHARENNVVPIRPEETVSEPAPVEAAQAAKTPEPATESTPEPTTTPNGKAREFAKPFIPRVEIDKSDPTVVF